MPRPETPAYLSKAYRHLKEHGKWPTARDMEREMQDDYLKAAQTLRKKIGPGFPVEDWNVQVRLPLSALLHTPIVRSDLEVFVRALPTISAAYRKGRPHPVLSSRQLIEAGFSEEDVRAAWRILEIEASLSEGSRYTGPDDWEFTLSTIFPKVAHARSVEKLLAVIFKLERKRTRRFRGWYAALVSRVRVWAQSRAAKVVGWIIVGSIGSVIGGLILLRFLT